MGLGNHFLPFASRRRSLRRQIEARDSPFQIYTVHLCKVERAVPGPTTKDVPPSVARATAPQRLDRPDLEHMAAASLVAAALVAVLRGTQPFEHGIWLVAYLFLVGFLAQLLLGRGQATLLSGASFPGPSPVRRRAECVLWNVGVVIVPVGVVAETRLAVLIGTMALLGALVSFFGDVRPVLSDNRNAAVGRFHLALLVFMAASAITGLALAWDTPWS